jgi:murein hydrolase activator
MILRMIRLPAKQRRLTLGLAALLALAGAGAFAQAPSPAPEPTEQQRELETLRNDLARSKEAEAKLKAEIESIKDDRKKLSQAMIDAAARMRAVETKLTAAESRLTPLGVREAALKQSLDARNGLISDVLGALARRSRQPPPVLLQKPEDALESMRAAILLGAAVPELKAGVEALAADLAELARLRVEIATERDALAIDRTALEEDRRRISALVEERQKSLGDNEKALESERGRAQALAKQVENVRELVARMEREVASAIRAAEAARQAEVNRIGLTLSFKDAKGRLHLPVAGTRVREFGAADGLGGSERGISVETRASAQIVTPADGWVVYAGNFRSYGQLLIINAGGGYHILLAGMERITVELGQFVLTGEPVAVMGNGLRLASAAAFDSSQPILYIEFRKDGNSIDPSPWWATSEDEKARG